MSYSDVEIARLIVDAETSRIGYDWFDKMAGLSNIPNSLDKSGKRYQVMKRVNTILEKGMQANDEYGAYRLVVGEKDDHYELKTMADSASIAIHSATEKATKAIDRAAQMSAYVLGEKQYFRITDRRFAKITKQPPALSESELSELRIEYRMLRQNQSILLAMLSNAENNIENIERLMGRAKPKNKDMVVVRANKGVDAVAA